MKLSIFTSLLAVFSGLVASVPVPDAEPSEIEARSIATIHPLPNTAVVIYSPDGGYQSDYAYVSRWTSNGQQSDYNTLLPYVFTKGYPGKQCTFSFSNGGWASGTRKVQLFSVGGPITPSNTFTHRPYRNISYGIFTVAADGLSAKWDDIPTPVFPCPASATTLGFEVVPQGDSDSAGWQLSGGLAIEVLP